MKKNKIFNLNRPEETANDMLTEIIREGAQKILKEALEIEIEAFVDEYRELRTGDGKRRIDRLKRTTSEILDRVLLHWDTETGVFGIKDNTFREDKVRYFSLAGVRSRVAILNIARNCLSTQVFKPFWDNDSMRNKIQFWHDNPGSNHFIKY